MEKTGMMSASQKAKMRMGRIAKAQTSKDGKVKARPRPTRAMIRAKCADCLNLKGNGCRGFDCSVRACPLYLAMPWLGKDLPAHMKDDQAAGRT